MANTMAVPFVGSGYGAAELKLVYQKYMSIGLLTSTIMMFSTIGSYYGIIWLTEEEEPVHMVRITKYSELGPPPSLQSNQAAPAVSVTGQAVKPSVEFRCPFRMPKSILSRRSHRKRN
jgi:hypothetical protein